MEILLWVLVSIAGGFIGSLLYEATIGYKRDKRRGFKDQDTLR